MRGLLVIPPSPFLLDERMFPALGVLKVAAAREALGDEVDVLDLSGHAAEVTATGYDWAGVTTTTPQLPSALSLVAQLRQQMPQIPVVLGGPHVTLVHAAAKREWSQGRTGRATAALGRLRQATFRLVAGDGERGLSAALDTDGLVDADDPDRGLFLSRTDLDASPLPARHLIALDSYRAQVEGVPATSLIGQLGCPFGCGFCGGRLSPSFRRIRLRSVEKVVEELEHLHTAYGYRGFVFMDDEVNVAPNTVALMDAITDLQDRLGETFALRGHVKAQLLTDAQAAAMKRAGYKWIFVGFESGHPRILDNIQKQATRDENTRCLDIARRHGLKVKALMSVGHPGETFETLRATDDWIRAVRPDDVGLSLITVYPGTPYYDHAIEETPGIWAYRAKNGDVLYSDDPDFEHEVCYFKGIPGQYRSFVWTDALSKSDLTTGRDALEAGWTNVLKLTPLTPAIQQIEQSMGMTL